MYVWVCVCAFLSVLTSDCGTITGQYSQVFMKNFASHTKRCSAPLTHKTLKISGLLLLLTNFHCDVLLSIHSSLDERG